MVVGGRGLAPIDKIARTAAAISAANLSQRINEVETKSELGALAAILNDMFARLQAAFERQTRFTADAAHELRTPLAVILSQSELALNRQRSEQEYRDALESCQRAARRMKLLTEDLLTLARADDGGLNSRRIPCDLRQIVEDCWQMLQPLAEHKQITIAGRLEPVTILGDPERVAELVANLLANAIHYNRERGRIELELTARSGVATLTVADTGTGIAAEDQPHLFERFFRADKGRSSQQGGSGLGLALCKAIVDAHGGQITFSSVPQHGTTFEVQLPWPSEALPASPSPG